MRAIEVGVFNRKISQSPYARHKIWQLEIQKLTPDLVKSFVAVASMRGLKAHALEAIDHLQTELICESVSTDLSDAELVLLSYRPASPIVTLETFMETLEKLPAVYRQAILFALHSGVSFLGVTNLTWKTAGRLYACPEPCLRTLMARADLRHPKLNAVFWEGETIPSPLYLLRSRAEAVFERSESEIRTLWDKTE